MQPPFRKVAIPRYGESVAPCFGHSATVSVFTFSGSKVKDQADFVLASPQPLDRVRLLRDQEVDTLICGGLQDRVEDIIRANGIRVISFVSGDVERLLDAFVHGDLEDGRDEERSGSKGPVKETKR